jgi:hypothetical protein
VHAACTASTQHSFRGKHFLEGKHKRRVRALCPLPSSISSLFPFLVSFLTHQLATFTPYSCVPFFFVRWQEQSSFLRTLLYLAVYANTGLGVPTIPIHKRHHWCTCRTGDSQISSFPAFLLVSQLVSPMLGNLPANCQ